MLGCGWFVVVVCLVNACYLMFVGNGVVLVIGLWGWFVVDFFWLMLIVLFISCIVDGVGVLLALISLCFLLLVLFTCCVYCCWCVCCLLLCFARCLVEFKLVIVLYLIICVWCVVDLLLVCYLFCFVGLVGCIWLAFECCYFDLMCG